MCEHIWVVCANARLRASRWMMAGGCTAEPFCLNRRLEVGVLTCRNCRIPPLIRNESAAMPAIPSPGSRNCRREAALGVVPVCRGQQHPEQQHADASGCELCRIMRALGDVVTRTGGGGAWQGQQ